MRTFAQAAERWTLEGLTKSYHTKQEDARTISDLHRQLPEHLSAIDLEAVANLRTTLALTGLAPSTINRRLSVLRAILRAAVSWGWLTTAPTVRQFPERTHRTRWLTRNQARQLLDRLPDHLADMAEFSLHTGLRRSNVTNLCWRDVDLSSSMAWIHADEAKGGSAIPVPLSKSAKAVLQRRQGIDLNYCFTYRGKPVFQTCTKAWRNAVRDIGQDQFRWHDLRHTWASWHAQAGTPMFALQQLGGWKSPRMLQRYAHLGAHHLAAYAEKMSESG